VSSSSAVAVPGLAGTVGRPGIAAVWDQSLLPWSVAARRGCAAPGFEDVASQAIVEPA